MALGIDTIRSIFAHGSLRALQKTPTTAVPTQSNQQKGTMLQQNWRELGWTVPTLSRHTGVPESTIEAIGRGDSVNLSYQQISRLAPAISRYEMHELAQVTNILASLK